MITHNITTCACLQSWVIATKLPVLINCSSAQHWLWNQSPECCLEHVLCVVRGATLCWNSNNFLIGHWYVGVQLGQWGVYFYVEYWSIHVYGSNCSQKNGNLANWNCESVQSQKSWGKNVLAVERQQADMLWWFSLLKQWNWRTCSSNWVSHYLTFPPLIWESVATFSKRIQVSLNLLH